MSISGPCLWLPSLSSLSSPIPSSFSTLTSRLSEEPRHGERVFPSTSRTVSPLLTLFRNREPGASRELATEMNQSGGNAENTVAALPMSTTGSSLYPGRREMSSRELNGQGTGVPKDELKLEIPDNGGNVSLSRPPVGAGDIVDETHASQMDLKEPHGEQDKDSSISPSDEKDESTGGDESHRSPILDKKKMKRFRLTHNQTRFLMSEFTRQAHPDAAHRERLSREIPGLTPRQVQVWFQNRRAKLKRLTTNDRERMLNSRALPENFDTTKVLRAPFESRSNGHTPIASPHSFGAPNPDFAALRALRTDFFHRPSDEEYLVSPLSSASTAGTYMSSAGRNEGLPPSNLMFGRPAASSSMSDLHRTMRSDYSIARSGSLSEPSGQPHVLNSGVQLPNRYSGQNGMSCMRQPMEYVVSRAPNGMAVGYDQHQPLEDSVSPTDSLGGQVAYGVNGTSASQSFSEHKARPNLDFACSQSRSYSTQLTMPSNGRHLSTMQEYRPYSYTGSSNIAPYNHANNSSNLSMSNSFTASESGSTSTDQTSPQTIDSIRSKFNAPAYGYASYIQQ